MVDLKKEKEPIEGVERVVVPQEVSTTESIRQAHDRVPKDENLEVDSWIAKIEKRLGRIPKGQPGVQDDSVVVQAVDPVQANQPPITLPVNQQQMAVGKKAKPELSIAWLVTWAIRQIKMLTKLGRRVELSQLPEIEERSKEG